MRTVAVRSEAETATSVEISKLHRLGALSATVLQVAPPCAPSWQNKVENRGQRTCTEKCVRLVVPTYTLAALHHTALGDADLHLPSLLPRLAVWPTS